MPKTTQLVLSLESKPGVLAKLTRTLARAGVNMRRSGLQRRQAGARFASS